MMDDSLGLRAWMRLVGLAALTGCTSPEPAKRGHHVYPGPEASTDTAASADTAEVQQGIEGSMPGMCGDGADNDEDGLIDCDDPSCASDADCWDSEVPAPHIVNLRGSVYEALTMTQFELRMCMEVATVASYFAGGDLTVLTTVETEADGSWEIHDLPIENPGDLLLSIDHCPGDEEGLLTSATRIPTRTLAAVEDGGTLEDIRALVMTRIEIRRLNEELSDTTVDIDTQGALWAYILDADGAPVEGATVHWSDGPVSVFYPHAVAPNFKDEAGEFYAATGPLGLAIVPGGWTGTYTVEADGHSFPAQTEFVIHRTAVYTRFYADG